MSSMQTDEAMKSHDAKVVDETASPETKTPDNYGQPHECGWWYSVHRSHTGNTTSAKETKMSNDAKLRGSMKRHGLPPRYVAVLKRTDTLLRRPAVWGTVLAFAEALLLRRELSGREALEALHSAYRSAITISVLPYLAPQLADEQTKSAAGKQSPIHPYY
jgi:hypothetical protein